MSTSQTRYFVVSLPRTGTKSLCKMVETVGMKIRHAPSVHLHQLLNASDVQFFADTPLYAPSHIPHLLVNVNHKFIYIDRDPDEWKNSFERVGLYDNYNSLLETPNRNVYQELDKNCLAEVFSNEPYDTTTAIQAFHTHRQTVFDNIPADRLLIYRFVDGWEPLCSFLETDVPSEDIPHINKNTMFDAI
jgi:hypothetical protein